MTTKQIGRFLFFLAAAGFVLRAIFIFLSNDYTNPVAYESGLIADNIVAGKGFAFQNWTASKVEPTAWIPPLYPYFLAFFFKVFGPRAFLAIELVQGLAFACLVYPTYGLGNHFHNRKVGLTAALLASVYPPFIYYTRVITYDGLFTLFVASSLYGLVSLSVSPDYPKAAAAGCLLALANLTKAILVPFTLLVLPWLGWALGGVKRRWKYPLVVGVTCLAALTPWLVRNAVVFHRLMPLQGSFGYMLWLGNRPGFPGIFDPTQQYKGTGLHRLTPEEKQLLREMSESQMNDYLLHRAVRDILADPAAFLKRSLYRVYAFWWISEQFARGEPLKRESFRNAASLIGFRKLNLALLYLFAALGLVLSLDKKKIHFLFLLLFLTLTALNALTQSSLSRYQLPVEFPLLIYVAFALVFLWEKIRPRPLSV